MKEVSLPIYYVQLATETWWNSNRDWNTGVEDYALFRKDRKRRLWDGIVD